MPPLHRMRARLGGAGLGLFAVLLLASTALHPWVPEDPRAGAAAVQGSAAWRLVHVVVLAALAAAAVGFLAVPAALVAGDGRGARAGAGGAGLAWAAGALGLAASMAMELTQVPALAPAAAAGDAAAMAAFAAAHGTSVVLFTFGLLLLCTGAALLAAALHAAVAVPRWASTLGLAGMPLAAALSGLALLLPDPARVLVGLGAMLLLVAWMGILGLVLLGWSGAPAPGTQPRAAG